MSERYSVTYSGSNYFQGSFKSELSAKRWATQNIQPSVGCSMLVHVFYSELNHYPIAVKRNYDKAWQKV